jgi:predicted signal transduction protein with EAL and GGDEF domain
MDIVVDHKQISADDKVLISKQVKADLVDHLYQGCLPGTISGVVLSILFFLDYRGYTPTSYLVAWFVTFNIMMLALSSLFFTYTKYKHRLHPDKWEKVYSVTMIGCALAWVPAVVLMPADLTRQYLALIMLYLATNGYSTGTIGQFKLCVVTLHILMVPLIVWCFMKGGIFYNIVGTYSILYIFFLTGTNHRSTTWFKDSLKLKLENNLVSYQANHDLLTDLPNQRLLPRYVESAISLVKNTNKTFALVCFSLNRMEMINDTLGHQAGNYIIQSVASRLNTLAIEMTAKENSLRCIVTI